MTYIIKVQVESKPEILPFLLCSQFLEHNIHIVKNLYNKTDNLHVINRIVSPLYYVRVIQNFCKTYKIINVLCFFHYLQSFIERTHLNTILIGDDNWITLIKHNCS